RPSDDDLVRAVEAETAPIEREKEINELAAAMERGALQRVPVVRPRCEVVEGGVRGSSARVEPKELNAVEIAAEREPRNAVLDQHGGIDGVPGILARLLDVRADHPTVVNEALRIFGTRAHGVSDARAIAAVRRGGVVEV